MSTLSAPDNLTSFTTFFVAWEKNSSTSLTSFNLDSLRAFLVTREISDCKISAILALASDSAFGIWNLKPPRLGPEIPTAAIPSSIFGSRIHAGRSRFLPAVFGFSSGISLSVAHDVTKKITHH